MGRDFPPARFLRTPIGLLRTVLKELDDTEKVNADISSYSTAKLATLVLQLGYALNKTKSPKVTIKDYLPFAHTPESSQPPKDGPSPATREVLLSALRQGQIPLLIYQELSTPASPEDG
jgi:hypothetical protein